MKLICDNPNCRKEFVRKNNRVFKANYCCDKCRREMLSKYNKEENPLNKKEYWTAEKRAMKRESALNSCTDNKKTYCKYHQRHLHRVVAEEKIGRPLKKDEVVHHINSDIRDNSPENLQVMTKSEHARLHSLQYWEKKKGGDLNACSKE